MQQNSWMTAHSACQWNVTKVLSEWLWLLCCLKRPGGITAVVFLAHSQSFCWASERQKWLRRLDKKLKSGTQSPKNRTKHEKQHTVPKKQNKTRQKHKTTSSNWDCNWICHSNWIAINRKATLLSLGMVRTGVNQLVCCERHLCKLFDLRFLRIVWFVLGHSA